MTIIYPHIYKLVRTIYFMNSKKEEIKAVIFDVGGVLSTSDFTNKYFPDGRHKGVHEQISRELNIPLDVWLDAIDETYVKAIEGKLSEKEAIRTISKNVEISRYNLKKVILKAYKTHFKDNKELYNFAFSLRNSGYKIAILSDQWPISEKALINKKYLKKFNIVVISCRVKLRKPNSKIYKLTLKKLKLPAKNCVFIDNHQWNLNPAEKLGMKTILFISNNQTINALRKIDVRIK